MIVYPPIAPDSLDVSVYFRAAEASTGTNPGDPVTVTSATAGLTLSYRRRGAAAVSITLSDLTALTDAHTDGGLLVVGAGIHRLDVPDAAFADGSDDVLIFGSATDIVIFGALVPLGIPFGSFDAGVYTGDALLAIQSSATNALTAFPAPTTSDTDAIRLSLPGAIRRSTALPDFQFLMVDQNREPLEGLVVMGQKSIDDGPFTNLVNSPTEIGDGMYKVDLAVADTAGEVITYKFSATGARTRFITVITRPA